MSRNSASCLSLVLLVGCAGSGRSVVAISGDGGLEQDLSHFDFSEAGAWTLQHASVNTSEGLTHWLELSADDPAQPYQPPHRSPRRMALLREPVVGDFRLEFDALSTGRSYGHRDLCVFFAWTDPASFHYLHLAPVPDERSHNLFLVDHAARRSLAPVFEEGLAWPDDTWVHLVIERRGKRVVVQADGVVVLSTDQVVLERGRVGVGSFDDSGRFANMSLEEL